MELRSLEAQIFEVDQGDGTTAEKTGAIGWVSDKLLTMLTGAHVLLYSNDPEADRVFFRDVLEFPSVDAGGGWLIFALPPAELALHPIMGNGKPAHGGRGPLGGELYLMCDDLPSLIQSLRDKNVSCSRVETAPWGLKSTIGLPSGGEVGLYQPTHPTALNLRSK